MNKTHVRTPRFILGMRVDSTSYEDAANRVIAWATAGASEYVCAANVHMVMEAYDSKEFRNVVNGAALVTPDGVPLTWAMRMLGRSLQERVYGPDLMMRVCQQAEESGTPVGLYGGHLDALQLLTERLTAQFPRLKVAYIYSPPFRPLSEREEQEVVRQVNISGIRILFVGLGCPKQEYWMASQKGRINTVMIGVGAAFDFHSGRVKQAPELLQKIGMEWFFRLLMEPRRLWVRYLKHNPRFVLFFVLQLLGLGRFKEG